MALLHGISDNIKEIVKVCADIIVNFINNINLNQIIDAAVNLLITFLKGISDKLMMLLLLVWLFLLP
jgi:hypothetical protein